MRILRGEKPRDTKIQQRDAAIGGDENVRRLEIAVDDEVAMRVLYGVAHVAEELETCLDGQLSRLTVRIDRFAGDVLHGEPGNAIGGDATVEEVRDSRMIELRENLPFLEKALI